MTSCPYCNKPAQLVSGDVIYPRRADLATLQFWQCVPCRAYVGCHKAGDYIFIAGRNVISDGTLPLGRLADADLRLAKQMAHSAFDHFWVHARNKGSARKREYQWLAKALGIPVDLCHIGEFDIDQCYRVFEACESRTQANFSNQTKQGVTL